MKALNLIILLTLILLPSCGDSPFLEDDSTPTEGVNSTQALGSELNLALTKSQLSFNYYWQTGPHIGNESKLLIIISDKDGRPADPEKEFSVMIWMPTMGHGSFPISVSKVQQGIYEAKEIFFTMPGLWDIHFQLLNEGNSLDEEVLTSLTL